MLTPVHSKKRIGCLLNNALITEIGMTPVTTNHILSISNLMLNPINETVFHSFLCIVRNDYFLHQRVHIHSEGNNCHFTLKEIMIELLTITALIFLDNY